MSPLLSIVTINRNNAAGLSRTLQSLQTMRDAPGVEFVFVDGASSDNSVAVARKFYRATEVVSEPDSGIYNAMNKGLKRASGKYVLWLNSGDALWASFDLAKYLDYLSSSNADVISGKMRIVSHQTQELIEVRAPSISSLPWQTLPHQSTVFGRRMLLDFGGYDECFRIAGDRDLVVRLFLGGKSIELVDWIISEFFTGGVSSSRQTYIEDARSDLKNGLVPFHRFAIRIFRFQAGHYRRRLVDFTTGRASL